MAVTIVDWNGAGISASRTAQVTFGTNFADPQLNDVVILFPAVTTPGQTITIPAGWVNPLGGTTDIESSNHQLCVVYHQVTEAEAASNPTTFAATNLYDVAATGNVNGIAIRGVDPANVIDSIATAFNSTAATTPHVLPALPANEISANSLVIGCVAKATTGTYSVPAGWTLANSLNNNLGTWTGQRTAKTSLATAVAATNITPSAGDRYCSVTIALSAAVARSTKINQATSRASLY